MTITEFLLARIAEDEAVAQQVVDDINQQVSAGKFRAGHEPDTGDMDLSVTEVYSVPTIAVGDGRLLAECVAKRALLEGHSHVHECMAMTGSGARSTFDGRPWELWELEHSGDAGRPCYVLRCLAGVYVDHQDYQEEWAV